MGKVTVYCLISGCTPEIHFPSSDNRLGPGVQAALKSLLNEDERKGLDDIVAITCVGSEGRILVFMEEINPEDVPKYSDSDIRVIPCSVDEELWDFGSVKIVDPSAGADSCVVSMGPCFMVQTTALAILDLATQGRVTPQRFWRLAMAMGQGAGDGGWTIDGIDYGKEMKEYSVWQQDPSVIPAMELEKVRSLEKLGDVEKIKRTIVHEGCFWLWMRPDRFPLVEDSNELSEPCYLHPPSDPQLLSPFESLSTEILTLIASNMDSPATLCALTTVSRQLQFKMLGTESDRNSVSRAWICANAPWYIPHVVESGERKGNDNSEHFSTKNIKEVPTDDVLTWAYLKRCTQSGSLRNRERIWGVAQRIEKKCNELGL